MNRSGEPPRIAHAANNAVYARPPRSGGPLNREVRPASLLARGMSQPAKRAADRSPWREPWVCPASLSPAPLPPARERGAGGGVRGNFPGLAPWATIFRPFGAFQGTAQPRDNRPTNLGAGEGATCRVGARPERSEWGLAPAACPEQSEGADPRVGPTHARPRGRPYIPRRGRRAAAGTFALYSLFAAYRPSERLSKILRPCSRR